MSGRILDALEACPIVSSADRVRETQPMRWIASSLLAASVAAGLLAGCAGSRREPGPPAARPPALDFIEDDFTDALRRAKEIDRPLFVEVWAPW